MREQIATTILITSRTREIVDEMKRILHPALLEKHSPSAVIVRKTTQKITKWNRQVYEAKITVETWVEVAEQQTTLFRGY